MAFPCGAPFAVTRRATCLTFGMYDLRRPSQSPLESGKMWKLCSSSTNHFQTPFTQARSGLHVEYQGWDKGVSRKGVGILRVAFTVLLKGVP
jgi:hypothetical protein